MTVEDERCMNLVNQLNRDIQGFIRKSIESSSFNIEKWSPLSYGSETIRCWEIKGCRNEECPSYGDQDYRCWLTTGTLCGGQVQGEFAKKIKTCFDCEIFKNISGDSLGLLYENINILIFHIEEKTIRLRELAIKDPLTGLYNRNFLNEVIKREAAWAARTSSPLSFLMLDIDSFKQVNDTLGHSVGDHILKEAATLIKKNLRETDYLFRWGGDEFLIILPNTDCDKLINVVPRLLTAVDGWNKDSEAGYGYKLSFSIGCSTCTRGCDYLKALEEADSRMYQNKMEKRNNVSDGSNS